jgi:hypothetical protein
MIAAELAQRRFVQLMKNLAQLFGFRITGGETRSVNPTQRADKRVAVFAADFTILVAVVIVETCPAHLMVLSVLPIAESILPLGPNGN